jgi:hypothetical protein
MGRCSRPAFDGDDMGAEQFSTRAKGKTAVEAFAAAVSQAQYDHGHSGYTGTIAEKKSFKMVTLPAGIDAASFIRAVLDDEPIPGWEAEITKAGEIAFDKWGPAACVQVDKETFAFFGLASC